MSARMAHILLPAGLLPFALGLAAAVLDLPERSVGLKPLVEAKAAASGVENLVTAVLLNFRGYDTLLEVAVLSLAIVGIWSVAVMPRRRAGAPDPVLAYLVRILAPFMILLGAWLLWAGSYGAGGAFQAGAVFAAALVLVLLAGGRMGAADRGWPARTALMAGLLVFAAVGAATMAGGRFLEFPTRSAGGLILLIEAAAAVSIGFILASAFRGGRPAGTPQ